MKGWALLPLLAASGCLYLDRLNHAPTISIADGITSTNRGGMLTVHPIVNDVEDGPKGVTVTYQMTVAGSTDPLDPQCDYDATLFGNDLSVRFFRAGIYEVKAIAADGQHAQAEASVMVTITDAPPVFSSNAAIQQTATRDACNYYPAGNPVTLTLDGSVTDGDMTPATCPGGETLTYTWTIKDWPAGSAMPTLGLFDGTNCPPAGAGSGKQVTVTSPTAQICLRTDPNVTGPTALYTVVLDVADGANKPIELMSSVAVYPNEPPCITGTNPVAGSYVVDRSQLQLFDVDGAVDDRDHFSDGTIGFVWSVRRDSDATWTEVPNWRLSTYQLDPSSFGVGETVHVRVEAVDQSNLPAPGTSCPSSTADCTVKSCITAPLTCHKWKTWDLELR
jgi:hypothetical protein